MQRYRIRNVKQNFYFTRACELTRGLYRVVRWFRKRFLLIVVFGASKFHTEVRLATLRFDLVNWWWQLSLVLSWTLIFQDQRLRLRLFNANQTLPKMDLFSRPCKFMPASHTKVVRCWLQATCGSVTFTASNMYEPKQTRLLQHYLTTLNYCCQTTIMRSSNTSITLHDVHAHNILLWLQNIE